MQGMISLKVWLRAGKDVCDLSDVVNSQIECPCFRISSLEGEVVVTVLTLERSPASRSNLLPLRYGCEYRVLQGRRTSVPRFVAGCIFDFGFHLANVEHGIPCLWGVRRKQGWSGLLIYLIVHGLDVVYSHARNGVCERVQAFHGGRR